jgi:hypothetical protein
MDPFQNINGKPVMVDECAAAHFLIVFSFMEEKVIRRFYLDAGAD